MTVTQHHRRRLGKGTVTRMLGAVIAARQRRLLVKIESRLSRTDPRLASKFGMFSRLANGEEMPWIEQLMAAAFRRDGEVMRVGRLSQLLRIAFGLAAPAALVTALTAGSRTPAHCAPVKAAQGSALQFRGVPLCTR
jgi:hypothetical protein